MEAVCENVGPQASPFFLLRPFFKAGHQVLSLLSVALNEENPAGDIVAHRAVEGFPVFWTGQA